MTRLLLSLLWRVEVLTPGLSRAVFLLEARQGDPPSPRPATSLQPLPSSSRGFCSSPCARDFVSFLFDKDTCPKISGPPR